MLPVLRQGGPVRCGEMAHITVSNENFTARFSSGLPRRLLCWPPYILKNIFRINSQNGNFMYLWDKPEWLRVISKKILREFWIKHPDCEQQLKAWYYEANKSSWKNPGQIKKCFPSASFLQENRVVFNIKGNQYRIIVRINYPYQMVWIRFVGTHSEYDRVDALKV